MKRLDNNPSFASRLNYFGVVESQLLLKQQLIASHYFHFIFLAMDDGPFWMSAEEREAH